MLPCSITKINCPGGNEIVSFGGAFLGYHYHILILSYLFPEVEREIFKEIHQFNTFYPKITFS